MNCPKYAHVLANSVDHAHKQSELGLILLAQAWLSSYMYV